MLLLRRSAGAESDLVDGVVVGTIHDFARVVRASEKVVSF